MSFIAGQALAYLKVAVLAAVIIGAVALLVRAIQKRGAEKDGD